jgi:hypothetical protein
LDSAEFGGNRIRKGLHPTTAAIFEMPPGFPTEGLFQEYIFFFDWRKI